MKKNILLALFALMVGSSMAEDASELQVPDNSSVEQSPAVRQIADLVTAANDAREAADNAEKLVRAEQDKLDDLKEAARRASYDAGKARKLANNAFIALKDKDQTEVVEAFRVNPELIELRAWNILPIGRSDLPKQSAKPANVPASAPMGTPRPGPSKLPHSGSPVREHSASALVAEPTPPVPVQVTPSSTPVPTQTQSARKSRQGRANQVPMSVVSVPAEGTSTVINVD